MRSPYRSVLAVLLLAGCSCGGSEAQPEPADAGAADVGDAESGPDGTEGGKDAESEDAADAWDPVWHETEAKDWPTAPQATEPSCGQGCRVALDVPPYAPSYIHFQDSEFGLAAVNVSQRNVFYAPFGSDETFIVAQGDLAEMSNGFSQPYLRGELLSVTYMRPGNPGGEVRVINLRTGETKAHPAVGKELVVWKAVAEGFERNPSWAQEVYGVTQDLMVLDRKTGQRCRIHSDIVKYFTHMVVRGRTVYGNVGHVVGIDVDDPGIGCVPE